MTNRLNNAEIKEKSVHGAKWLLITNLLNIPSAFLISYFLGHISHEALGAYGLIQIFLSTITTFVFLGGQTVLRNFLAKNSSPDLRGKTLFTYALLILGLFVIMIGLFAAFPSLFYFFIRQKAKTASFIFFIFFSLMVIASELLSSATAGMMNIKSSTIAQAVTRLFPLPVITFLYFFDPTFLNGNAWPVITILYAISFTLSSAISLRSLIREKRIELNTGIFLPRGFIPFCLTTHLATIFSFIYNDVDKIFMLRLGAMGGLGLYQAVVSITRFIDFAPHILGAALVPLFSTLVSGGNRDAVKKAYDFIQRYSVISIIVLSIATIAFSRELLSILGKGYSDYFHVLALFGLSGGLCSLFLGNTALLTSYEKNTFRLLVSTVQIAVQLAGTFFFINTYGVLAVAGAKVAGRILANIINNIYIATMSLGIKIPRVFWMGSIICTLSFFVRVFLLPAGFYWSLAIFLISIVTFCFFGKITRRDIVTVNTIFRQKSLSENG